MASITLDVDSTIGVFPVVRDASNNPVSNDLLTRVRLGDLQDFFTSPASLPVATVSANGVVKQAAAQANSTATDVAGIVTDFNALLAKLRTAGLLAV